MAVELRDRAREVILENLGHSDLVERKPPPASESEAA
jgi:hypothetical protein